MGPRSGKLNARLESTTPLKFTRARTRLTTFAAEYAIEKAEVEKVSTMASKQGTNIVVESAERVIKVP
jgi:hypothetical protein